MPRIWTFDSNVNTDQIVPGRYAPYMLRDESEVRRYVFVEARPEFAAAVAPGDLIVAGPNFGCGSSREYAPLALKLAGVGAVIAPGFARIFYRNAINLGLPLFEADLSALPDGAIVALDVRTGLLQCAGGPIQLAPPPAWVQEVWEAGGIVPFFRATGRFPGVPAL